LILNAFLGPDHLTRRLTRNRDTDLFRWECCMRAYWWSSLWLSLVRHSFHDESESTKIKKIKYFVCFHREWLYNLRDASKQHYCDHFQWFRAKSNVFAVHFDHIWESQIDFDLEQCSNSLKWWSHLNVRRNRDHFNTFIFILIWF
jgi:hypothetical protein